jgi:glycerophosphoryl diester phosphodiesterase
MGWTRRAVGGGLLAAGAVNASAASRMSAMRPVVIAHRGASGERPEHTLSAYSLAIVQGADFIEPDLVVTRDGVLICRHENEIGGTTDVASRPAFADRRTTKTVDGHAVEGWFAEDFTLTELKTLRCRERLPELRPESAAFDGQEPILTFQELIDLTRSAPRPVGLYPELKHVGFLATAGHDLVALVAEQLRGAGLASRDAPVWVQCFEVAPLKRLRRLVDTRLVQLMAARAGPPDVPGSSAADYVSPEGLRAIADYADGLGAEKALVLPRGPDKRSLVPTRLARDAHAAGLKVNAWTCRAENAFLPLELRRGDPGDPAYSRLHGDLAGECRALFTAGVDGVFCDHPALAVAARNSWAA